MAASQVLNRKLAELTLHRLQNIFVSSCCRRADLGATSASRRTPPRRTGAHTPRMRPALGSRLVLCGLPFRSYSDGRSCSLSVDRAGVDRQLVAHDRLRTGALIQLNASDWGGSWRRSAISVRHHDAASVCAAMKRTISADVPAGGANLNPGEPAGLKEPIEDEREIRRAPAASDTVRSKLPLIGLP